MSKLESALVSINRMALPSDSSVSAPAWLIVTLAYLVALLSIPVSAPQKVIWLAVYPIMQSEISGIGYASLFRKSLWIVPLIALIAMFNPIVDRTVAFEVGGVAVTSGWVSFVSIILRGLLALQAVLLLTLSAGFYDMCEAMRRVGCPRILTSQIAMTYRYLGVLIEEALRMDRARKARGFGKKSYPLRMWGRMTGELLIRSYERAGRIHRAMLSRGFNGSLPSGSEFRFGGTSWIFLICWCVAIGAIRFVDISGFIKL